MTTSKLPPFLQKVYDHVSKNGPIDVNQFPMKRWKNFVSKACQEFPELQYDEVTELLTLGEISPGCKMCRAGHWDCFFVTPECNLSCDFCISQQNVSENFQGSNWGKELNHNLGLYPSYGIEGISFSGGEPLLKKQELFTWIKMCRDCSEIKHIWLYTNGLLINQEDLLIFAELGLDELRVNTAATGYQHPHILEMLGIASNHLNWVTVEIPLIPNHTDQLLNAIPKYVNAGVRNLNIHELMFEPGSNAERLTGKRILIHLPDGHQTVISPESNGIALKIFGEVARMRYSLSVNYCSMIGKWRQLTARRELILSEVKEPYESYLGDGVLESYYIAENYQAKPISAQMVDGFQKSLNKQPIYHLQRMAPLSLRETQKDWTFFEEIS